MKFLTFFIALIFISFGLIAQVIKDSTYSESEIILKTSTGDIYGTLTISNISKISPIVIIISGSGPTDRNCNSQIGLNTDAYKMLSEGLVKYGISTIRFDKRGIGKSKLAITNESELRFETYINDVVSWISLLYSDKRFSSIILLGHSEGSLIGMIAAEKTNITGYISVSGFGESADKILQEQLRTKLPLQLLEESNRTLDSLRIGKTVSNVNPNLASIYRPSIQPYMISWIKYDPANEIKKLKIPVLIIQGTTDLQVTVNDAKMLSVAKPNSQLLIIENMNHILKECDSDIQKNLETYRNPTIPLKANLIEDIVNFIKRDCE